MTSKLILGRMNAITYWGPKVSLARSEAVIELGKKLVAQLDADDDLLASWMAHDIAARMEAVCEFRSIVITDSV